MRLELEGHFHRLGPGLLLGGKQLFTQKKLFKSMTTQPSFTPLQEFWANFFETTSRYSPPARNNQSLKSYFNQIFGTLTDHTFENIDVLPFSILCHDCKNNTMDRQDAVCKTHLGILKGVLQAATHVPLEPEFHADPSKSCHILIRVDSNTDGIPATAHAKRLGHVILDVRSNSFVLYDQNTSLCYTLTLPAAKILQVLEEEVSVDAIVSATGIPDRFVRDILDQCYSLGWISCRFDFQESHD
jgi:hypothetical protein